MLDHFIQTSVLDKRAVLLAVASVGDLRQDAAEAIDLAPSIAGTGGLGHAVYTAEGEGFFLQIVDIVVDRVVVF